jgi:hypothetical protein
VKALLAEDRDFLRPVVPGGPAGSPGSRDDRGRWAPRRASGRGSPRKAQAGPCRRSKTGSPRLRAVPSRQDQYAVRPTWRSTASVKAATRSTRLGLGPTFIPTVRRPSPNSWLRAASGIWVSSQTPGRAPDLSTLSGGCPQRPGPRQPRWLRAQPCRRPARQPAATVGWLVAEVSVCGPQRPDDNHHSEGRIFSNRCDPCIEGRALR